jgi:class 3 adenylate cyclase
MAEGRRGTATVLFTDLVGSTALRSRLGEVAADEFRRRHDSALGSVVVDRGGVVVKSIGDGIMATFGSAADAIEAGVAAQQAVSRLAVDLGVEVRIRVGISAGDVSWEDGDCFGLPVVEAARLESAAEPGQILCSAIVQALAGGRVEVVLEPVGELVLKGLDAPVAAFSVPWSTPIGLEAVVEPFAGRQEALGRIAELIEGLVDGVGATLLVGGEPGAGKTRLVVEALRGERRVDVVWGHSFGGEVIPLGPVIEILDSLAAADPTRLRRCAAHHDRVVADLSPAAAAAWGDVVVPDPIDLLRPAWPDSHKIGERPKIA